jgi:hypothetical protein
VKDLSGATPFVGFCFTNGGDLAGAVAVYGHQQASFPITFENMPGFNFPSFCN